MGRRRASYDHLPPPVLLALLLALLLADFHPPQDGLPSSAHGGGRFCRDQADLVPRYAYQRTRRDFIAELVRVLVFEEAKKKPKGVGWFSRANDRRFYICVCFGPLASIL